MRITFRLRFHTNYGQSLLLAGEHGMLGGGDAGKALPMTYLNEQFWHVTLVFPPDAVPNSEIEYSYVLKNPDGSMIYDWGRGRTFNPAAFQAGEVLVMDSWNHAGFAENAFYTEPFQEVLLRANSTEVEAAVPGKVTHSFRAKAPLLAKGQTLCLLGDSDEMGNWNTAEPRLLSRSHGRDYFNVDLDLSHEVFPLSYKYGVYDVERKAFVRYEDGDNRTVDDVIVPGKRTIVNDGFVALASSWRGAGVAIPVFSLRSERSFGVGEFSDLKLLADWCQQVGLKLIQVLPVNDTTATHTWADSYPYSAISAFALHPLYLNLAEVATGANKKLVEELEGERRRLNALLDMDYDAVMKAKLALLRKIFPGQQKQTLGSKDFKQFFECNRQWLVPYAVFSYLRDKHGTPDFARWPENRECTPELLAGLSAEGSPAWEEVAFHYFVQFNLHLQLREATEYAHAKGVILKGDIPIGVSRYGSDAWQEPELYHMEMQAGAPPDAFSTKGQNWSFPTYNWRRMKENGFAWWKQRFEQMGNYFDAFRIDHILGFFRIWSIPVNEVEGLMGYFEPAIPVRLEEFINHGIRFDHNRFVKPHITERVLSQVFGKDQELVKSRFLEHDRFGHYVLRTEYATQRQVENYFAELEQNESNARLRDGLYELIGNVLLFDAGEGTGTDFHFRFALESTWSFRELDGDTQGRLRDLYIDYFFRRQDDFWMKEGLQKLPALKRVTNMLVCGEDLGLVPACVPVVMQQLGLLSLEIQRMPKKMNQEFFHTREAPYLSVVTPSTHDMSTIRGWWLEDRRVTQRFYNLELARSGEAPLECEGWINRAIVRQHLASPAMWSIFQLQDLLGMNEKIRRKDPADERINIPANPKHYWRYRMHLTLEELLKCREFDGELREAIEMSGR